MSVARPSVGWHRVRVLLDEPHLVDVAATTDDTLAASGVVLEPGSEVAVAVGSRGIRDLRTVVEQVIAWARRQGGHPFIVPAMGSHGGATPAGQRDVLASAGLTEATMGCAIRAGMDVVELPRGRAPVGVFTSSAATAASATVVVNRVKPHTDFHGRYESGLMKMIAIGLGKRAQAEVLHAHGVPGLRDLMPLVAHQVLDHANVVLGVAVVENALDETMVVEAVPASRIPEREPALLDVARRHSPRLPVDALDVLLVDRMGKDISGVGMDTNVIGRLRIDGEAEPATPRITAVACHELTAASHGNATGVGLADVVTRRLADATDHGVMATNIVTSGFLRRGEVPHVADDDAEAWTWCVDTVGVGDVSTVRAARIVDTLHCGELWVTDAVLAELVDRGGPPIEVVERDRRLHDDAGRLTPFAAP